MAKQRDIRRKAGAAITDGFFRTMSKASKLSPLARPSLHKVRVTENVVWDPAIGEEGLLDIYEPFDPNPHAPVVLYIHGGGFRILSKDTHWVMGLIFARRGYRVFNINYRKAPEHKFPTAHEDSFRAFEFLLDHADRFQIDPSKIIIAGESAGANLALSLAIAATTERPEPYAQRLYDRGIVPAAVIPKCGYLQVSDPARFSREHGVHPFIMDRLEEVGEAYFEDLVSHTLADPLLLLEELGATERPLPPVFASVGTLDILKHDSLRLGDALNSLGVPNQIKLYDGGIHAFQAFIFRQRARQAWRDTFDFLASHGLEP